MSDRWVKYIIESCRFAEERLEITNYWNDYYEEPGNLSANRGPGKIIPAQGTVREKKTNGNKPFITEAVALELPKGYYEERIKINRRNELRRKVLQRKIA